MNLFVEKGFPISSIITEKFQNEIRLETLEEEYLLDVINNLEFNFYYDDKTRVGKDNVSWEEVEIFNLPSNEYLIKLFLKILEGSLDRESNAINFSFNHTHFYANCSGRKQIEKNLVKVGEIKDTLKLNIQNVYNYLDDLFHLISNDDIK